MESQSLLECVMHSVITFAVLGAALGVPIGIIAWFVRPY
jgi:hypothetical protein